MRVNNYLRMMQCKWKRVVAPDRARCVTESGARVLNIISDINMHFIQNCLTFSIVIASKYRGDRSVGVQIFRNRMIGSKTTYVFF